MSSLLAWWQRTSLGQKVSTFTGAGYAGVGAVIGQGANPRTDVLAVALMVLALGTVLDHALEQPWTQRLDHLGMYMTMLALVGWLTGAPAWLMAVVALGAGLGVALALRAWIVPTTAMLMAALALVVVPLDPVLGGLAVGCAGVGAVVRPLPTWWGHGLWHLLTAAGVAMAYLVGV